MSEPKEEKVWSESCREDWFDTILKDADAIITPRRVSQELKFTTTQTIVGSLLGLTTLYLWEHWKSELFPLWK